MPNIIEVLVGQVSHGGDALAMPDTPMATSWTRCTYDHHIREQVVRTGTRCLPKHIRIPRSTVSTWRRRGQRPVVTIEPFDQDRQQLVDSIAKLDRRAGSIFILASFG
jgi:hypothetical protein